MKQDKYLETFWFKHKLLLYWVMLLLGHHTERCLHFSLFNFFVLKFFIFTLPHREFFQHHITTHVADYNHVERMDHLDSKENVWYIEDV